MRPSPFRAPRWSFLMNKGLSNRMTGNVLIAVTLLVLSVQAEASRFTGLGGDPHLRSESALVIDDGGGVIYEKDVDTIRPIASITKLMTAMVVIDSGVDLAEKIT